MSGPGSAIVIGGFRIPALAVGFSLSVAAHVGLMATLAVVPSGRGARSSAPPIIDFALGEPIQVRIVSEQDTEEPDASAGRSTTPEPHEPVPQIDATALAEAETPRERAREPASRELDQTHPVVVGEPTVDLAAIVESLRSIDWSQFVASSREPATDDAERVLDVRASEPEETSARTVPDERASVAVPPVATDRPTSQLASRDTPRGVDRGIAIVDLPRPAYPRRSIRLGHEGTAVVEITVRVDGSVRRVRLRATSGHKLLDDAAVKAARNGRFRPALRDGRAIEAVVIVPFEFNLADDD